MTTVTKKKQSLGTHDGSFHADEVTAAALLVVAGLVKEDQIVRTRDPAALKDCEYVCDVGGIYDPSLLLFDHHQADYQGPLSSAGMILKFLSEQKQLTLEEFHLLNNSLILGVDAHDNGVDMHVPGVCTYSQLIGNFSPIHYDSSPLEQDAAFQKALQFAVGHITRLLERHRYIHGFTKVIQEAMEQGRECLMFSTPIPWMDCFFELGGEKHPAQFMIMPSGSHWKLRGIPPSLKEKMKVRYPLPKEWAGLLDEDLKRASGIPGAIFCHKGRFFSLWETKDDAVIALNKILEKKT